MTNATLNGKSDAKNQNVRFDKGEVASYPPTVGRPEGVAMRGAKPRRGSLLYNMSVHAIALGCACSLGAVWADTLVDWQSSLKPESAANGAIGITYSGDAIATMTATNAVAERVVFSGDPISLSSAATLTFKGGPVVFSNELVAAGNVSIIAEAESFSFGSYNSEDTNDDLAYVIPGTPEIKVFSGLRLGDIEVLSGAACGNAVGADQKGLAMTPCHIVRTADSMAFQLQHTQNQWLKCVKIELTQRNDDIYAHAVYAQYGDITSDSIGNHKYQLGDDFDVYPGTSRPLASPGNWGYFSVKGLRVERPAKYASVEFASPFALSDALAVTGTTIRVAGAGTCGTGSTLASMSLSDATLVWSNTTAHVVSLDNPLDAECSTVHFAAQDYSQAEPESRAAAVTVQSSYVTVAAGAELNDLVGVSSAHLMQTGNIDLGDCLAYHFSLSEGKATCQIQADSGGWNKCALVEFIQSGADIKARVVRAYWQYTNITPLGTDMTAVEAYTKDTLFYYPTSMTLLFRSKTLVVNANADQRWTDGRLVIGSNVVYSVNKVGALVHEPSNTTPEERLTAEIEAGGVMRLQVSGDNNTGIANGTRLLVKTGGRLIQGIAAGTFGLYQEVEIAGGSLELTPAGKGSGSSTDAGTFLGLLAFRDGGRSSGLSPRIGNAGKTAVWRVVGSGEPCSHSGGVVLVNPIPATAEFSRKSKWLFEIEDLTGDDAVDFTFEGPCDDYVQSASYSYYGTIRRKTGNGTMRIGPNCVSSCAYARWEIADGSLRVAASDVFAKDRHYELALQGGNLELEAGVENSFETFAELSGPTRITLGEGSILSLPGAPSIWAEGATIHVTAGANARLRFGTTSTALTAAQLGRIRLNDERVSLDADGYLKRCVGLVLIFR